MIDFSPRSTFSGGFYGKRERLARNRRRYGGRGENLPIDYKLHDVSGEWKGYDVVIDHVSLVGNYRAQFERVIAKSSVHELLQKVKKQHQDS